VAVRAVRPTDVSHELGGFDRFAELASRLASRAWFFFCCVLIVVVWAPSLAVFKNIDTWQLVALLQNSQTRSDLALQHKLNAIADGLADLMAHLAKGDHGAMDQDMRELRAAVGLESRESTSDNEVDRPDGQAGPNGSTGSDGVKGGPPGAEPLAAVAPRRSAAEKPA
jgi:hypothetical protein